VFAGTRRRVDTSAFVAGRWEDLGSFRQGEPHSIFRDRSSGSRKTPFALRQFHLQRNRARCHASVLPARLISRFPSTRCHPSYCLRSSSVSQVLVLVSRRSVSSRNNLGHGNLVSKQPTRIIILGPVLTVGPPTIVAVLLWTN